MKSVNPRNEPIDEGARTPLWALVGAPVVMFLASSGAFWGAYSWMSVTNPVPPSGITEQALAKPAKAVSRDPEAKGLSGFKPERPKQSRIAAERPQTAAAPSPTLESHPLTPPEPESRRTPPAPQRLEQAPCPIQVTESRLAQGRSVAPPSGRRVAIVLHRSGSTAEGTHEAERQVIAVVNNLAPADSFTVVATAGQGAVFAPEPVTSHPQSVEALRSWMKSLPGGTTAPLEAGVSTALAMPAINKVVVVADVSPEREAETWRRLSDVVRTGNRFGAAVSAVTVTPRCTPAIAPAKGQGSGSEEPPSVAQEVIVAPGY